MHPLLVLPAFFVAWVLLPAGMACFRGCWKGKLLLCCFALKLVDKFPLPRLLAASFYGEELFLIWFDCTYFSSSVVRWCVKILAVVLPWYAAKDPCLLISIVYCWCLRSEPFCWLFESFWRLSCSGSCWWFNCYSFWSLFSGVQFSSSLVSSWSSSVGARSSENITLCKCGATAEAFLRLELIAASCEILFELAGFC